MARLFFILFSFLLFTSLIVVGPQDQSEEASAKIKAIYIYNFTKYIEWPGNYKEGNFVVGVLGNNPPLLTELTKMAATKKVGSQKLEILNLSSFTDDSRCNIVYILPDNSTQLSDVVNKLKSKSTLIVTDKPGLAKQGAAINFIISENKQRIELNVTNIEKYRLKVASTLVDMSVQVK